MDHVETVHAQGHENVTATHASTLEVTSDEFLTPAGDCIVGIDATSVPSDFEAAFVAVCQDAEATIEATGAAGEYSATVEGSGHPDLTFASDRSHVLRTSDYVDDRTVMVDADAAAGDIDRGLVAALADGADLSLTLRVAED